MSQRRKYQGSKGLVAAMARHMKAAEPAPLSWDKVREGLFVSQCGEYLVEYDSTTREWLAYYGDFPVAEAPRLGTVQRECQRHHVR